MELSSRARGFVAVTWAAVALFVAVALSGVSRLEWPFAAGASFGDVRNPCGPLGSLAAWTAIELFGRGFAWLVPALLGLMAADAARPGTRLRRAAVRVLTAIVLAGAVLELTPLADETAAFHGRIGGEIAAALRSLFGAVGGAIVLVAVLLIVGMQSLGQLAAPASRALAALADATRRSAARARAARARAGAWRESVAQRLAERDDERGADEPVTVGPGPGPDVGPGEETAVDAGESASGGPTPEGRGEGEPEISIAEAAGSPGRRAPGARRGRLRRAGERLRPIDRAALPPLSLLDRNPGESATYSRDELREWSGILESKLGNYGVEGRVTAVHHGPVVTTFEFEPAPGVRIREITSRADDLALAMRARSLRMIAPIPGRAAVGIEIPNPEPRTVYLADVIGAIPEPKRLRGVMLGLGVDVVGKPFVMNLCDAPHLLIAGTTGSGKSVCLNVILASILFQYRPSDVRLLLVDPKVVEMSLYEGIPHLLHPVITDPKDAAKVLEFLVAEMGRRNELFRRHGVRNIESYNARVARGERTIADGEPMERLPYVVLVVDELGDLALARGVDIESLLARLAQMARAAGIHMVLATQRPSVDVIVGKTKANFPTRIAFRVASKVDSRTILDTIGAEALLGRGDMLYLDARHPTPLRLHGAWVSEGEIEQLIAHWKSYEYEPSSLELSGGAPGAEDGDGERDPLFEKARDVVLRYRQGSTSLLQRKLRVGYSRAARLIDQLEQAGIVGPPDGSKPREVYEDRAHSESEA